MPICLSARSWLRIRTRDTLDESTVKALDEVSREYPQKHPKRSQRIFLVASLEPNQKKAPHLQNENQIRAVPILNPKRAPTSLKKWKINNSKRSRTHTHTQNESQLQSEAIAPHSRCSEVSSHHRAKSSTVITSCPLARQTQAMAGARSRVGDRLGDGLGPRLKAEAAKGPAGVVS